LTNFFDLGGHSLLLARVHGWLCQRLKREVPITALFQYPTVAALARFLEGDHDHDHDHEHRHSGAARRRRTAGRRQRMIRRRHRKD